MKPPRIITVQGPHPTPLRPPVLKAPFPISYLEKGPVKKLSSGEECVPRFPKQSSRIGYAANGRLRHVLGTGYVPCKCLPANQSTYPKPICLSRRRSKTAPIHPSLGGPSRPTDPRTANADWSACWLMGPTWGKGEVVGV